MEHDPDVWLQSNPAWPAIPTLLPEKSWLRLTKSIEAPPNNATDLLIGRDTWIGTAWETTPWGGMLRAKIINTDDDSIRYEPIRITVLTPGEVRNGTCVPAGGESRRHLGILLRSRVTGDLSLLRNAARVDEHADLPGRRPQLTATPVELELRGGTQRVSRQRLRIRTVVGAAAGAFLEQAITITADWSAAGAMTLAAAVAGAVVGAAGPFAATPAGRRLSRPLTLASGGDDPRSLILCILQYYVAHADQLGTRGDALILEAWRLLYSTAAADPHSAAVLADIASRTQALADQVSAVAEFLDAQAEVERAAARPRVEAIERQEDEEALEPLRDAPDEEVIDELTQELKMDAAARRTAARKLDEPA